jgi:hypothetical protein
MQSDEIVPRHLVLFFCVAIAACGHKTPEQKLLDTIDPADSWIATLQLTGEKWLANSVPTRFVRSTVDAAKKDFEKVGKALDQSDAPRPMILTVRHQLEVATAAAGDVSQAVQKNDRRTVEMSVRRFAAAHAALQQLQNQKSR